jgi:hypothetical protein
MSAWRLKRRLVGISTRLVSASVNYRMGRLIGQAKFLDAPRSVTQFRQSPLRRLNLQSERREPHAYTITRPSAMPPSGETQDAGRNPL